MISRILCECVASISQLKQNPMKTVAAAEGRPLAVLNRNRPAFYCIPPALWSDIQDRLDDIESSRVAEARTNEKEIPVDINQL